METLDYVTPGDVLREEFLVPLNMSARQLGRDLNVPANRITDILKGRRSITAETAFLLAKRFDTTPEFWLNLQNSHDLEKARDALLTRGIAIPEWGPQSEHPL